jgi:hypothetical protein
MIVEERSFEVVQLMLENDCEISLGTDFDILIREQIIGTHFHTGAADDISFMFIDNRETAFSA